MVLSVMIIDVSLLWGLSSSKAATGRVHHGVCINRREMEKVLAQRGMAQPWELLRRGDLAVVRDPVAVEAVRYANR